MKANLIAALRGFVNQRPGLDYANYGDVSAYRSELRAITKMRTDALEMLNYIAWHDSITVDMLVDAAKHNFSGRLEIWCVNPGVYRISYTTGQYWQTEYRRAVACVCAGLLWGYFRENSTEKTGEAIRKAARRELSRSIARQYFN
jgi:hypothetical protein